MAGLWSVRPPPRGVPTWGQAGSPYAEIFAALFVRQPDAEQRRWFTELQRLSARAATASAIVRGFDAIEVTAIVRTLAVPTLVLHARDDGRVPFDEGRRTASTIPNAPLIALDGTSHILQSGELALEQFLDGCKLGRTAAHAAVDNTEPFATGPTADNQWRSVGVPHIMVIT